MPAAGAKRQPHRQLPAASRRHREKQVRDIGAGDDKHQSDGPLERDEHRTRAGRERHREQGETATVRALFGDWKRSIMVGNSNLRLFLR